MGDVSTFWAIKPLYTFTRVHSSLQPALGHLAHPCSVGDMENGLRSSP